MTEPVTMTATQRTLRRAAAVLAVLVSVLAGCSASAGAGTLSACA
ncbi:hypothetical protein ACFO1B_39965 [Dactylosporangium siamense]|nr:hypothetical protein [Dactylosporangium siamense]